MIPHGESMSLHHCNVPHCFVFLGLANIKSRIQNSSFPEHHIDGCCISEPVPCTAHGPVITSHLTLRNSSSPAREVAAFSMSDMALSLVSTASSTLHGPVALPLFKFSHCTSPNPQAKMIWTHLPQRSDMFAVFDVSRKVGIGMIVVETKVLKLVRGGELLVSRYSHNQSSIHLS